MQRATLSWPIVLLLVLAGLGLAPSARADDGSTSPVDCARGVTISNGTVQLGVNCVGDLGNADDHGLAFLPTGAEAVSQGCACEGWGVADDQPGGVSGWANQSSGDSDNLTVHSFTADGTSAVSVVDVHTTSDPDSPVAFQVTQDFFPSPATPNLYEVDVSIHNVTDDSAHLRYRRVMDWDIEPTPFNEMVTLEQGSSQRIAYTSDDGFATSDPLAGPSKILASGSFEDSGPQDHGALFDFDFGDLDAGDSRSFKIFYGAADTEAHADAALNAVNAEAYSYGQPSTPGGADLGEPNTFVFGFKDIDGGAIFAPNAVSDQVRAYTDETRTIDVLKNDSDPNGDPITITGSTAADHGTASCDAKSCTYLSDPGYEGPDQFTYAVDDGNGGRAGATVSLTVAKRPANRPPVAVPDTIDTDEDTAGSVDVLANDTDPDEDDVLNVSGHTDGAHGTVTCDGPVCTYHPDADFDGTDSFDYTVTDARLESTGTVHVQVAAVDDAPVAVDDGAETDEDTSVSVPVTDNDTDVEGDALTTSVDTGPAHGSASCAAGSCTYVPDADWNGADSFTYRAFDGTAYSAPATVSVDVRAVEDAPVAGDDRLDTDEDVAGSVDVLANDTDVDGDTLTVTGATEPEHGVVDCSSSGCVYTPDADYSGPDSFTYDVSDGLLSATATVTVTVAPVDDAPVASDDDAATDEDTAVSVPVTDNDTDVDDPADALSAELSVAPEHGTVTCASGSCTYTPDADWNGTDSFAYRTSDGRLVSAPATVRVVVHPVDDAPRVVDDGVSTGPGEPVVIDVLDNDSDVDGDPLTITDPTTPDHGSVTCADTCTYTPDDGYGGDDGFDYTADDGNGGRTTGHVRISVRAADRAPVAVADSVTTREDTGTSLDVLANDTDPDGDQLSVTHVDRSVRGVSVTCATRGICSYRPPAGVSGSDSFTYTVDDGHGGSATGLVEVTITPVNHAPVIGTDALVTARDGVGSVDVLANDADPDGDALSVVGVTGVLNGTAACTAAGACTFTPNRHWAGSTSFGYVVSDGHGGTATGVVAVTVRATLTAPDAPTIGTAKAGSWKKSGKRYNALPAWKAPAWNGGSAVTRYTVKAVRYSGKRIVSSKTYSASARSSSLLLKLSRGTYAFTVQAVNGTGASKASSSSRKITVR